MALQGELWTCPRCGRRFVSGTCGTPAANIRSRASWPGKALERGLCSITFGLPRPLRHPRIRRVEHIMPGWLGHSMRVTSPEELDDEVLGWLRESYQQMGMQGRLAGRPPRPRGR